MPEVKASSDAIKYAVDLAKEGMTHPTGGSLVSAPDVVAQFIEVIAAKIDQLRGFRG